MEYVLYSSSSSLRLYLSFPPHDRVGCLIMCSLLLLSFSGLSTQPTPYSPVHSGLSPLTIEYTAYSRPVLALGLFYKYNTVYILVVLYVRSYLRSYNLHICSWYCGKIMIEVLNYWGLTQTGSMWNLGTNKDPSSMWWQATPQLFTSKCQWPNLKSNNIQYQHNKIIDVLINNDNGNNILAYIN